jgi:hypothetical protein
MAECTAKNHGLANVTVSLRFARGFYILLQSLTHRLPSNRCTLSEAWAKAVGE